MSNAKQNFSTNDAPPPIANYSQAVRKGNMLQVAGQVGIDPTTGKIVEGITAQTEQTFANLKAVLAAAGSSLDDVIMTRVYLADLADGPAMSAVYNKQVSEPFSARTTVGTALAPGILVEIDVLAVLD